MATGSNDGLTGPVTAVHRQSCLGCDARIDSVAVVGGGPTITAKAGDFAVCNRCGEVMRWTSSMQLRGLTLEEKQVAAKHPGIRSVSQAARTRAQA